MKQRASLGAAVFGLVASLYPLAGQASAAEPVLLSDACEPASANPDGVAAEPGEARALDALISDFASAGVTPSLAVGIVKGDRVVYARGFGYRNLETCAQADANTRYYLKSVSKSFLGLLAALMHEDGTVELDAPITEYLTDLSLPAPLNAEQISLRAHFTHTIPYFDSGLNYRTVHFGNIPDDDFIAHANVYSRPRAPTFRYSNFSPLMGAHALGRAADSNWRDLIETKVFAPAGMTSSFTYVAKAENGPAATSYLGEGDGAFVPVATKHEAQMVAPGGSFSTVGDLSRWLVLNLNDGALGGEQVFPVRAVKQAHARQVQLDWTYYEFHRFAHGLGLYSADYEGDVLMHHFGGETHVSFMPDHDLGVVVLTNAISGGGYVTHRLAAAIYDALLGKDDVEQRTRRRLNEIENALARRTERRTAAAKRLESEAPDGAPTFEPAALVGLYLNDRLGDAEIFIDGADLKMRIGVKESPLDHAGGDGYFADTGIWAPELELWVFRRNEDGRMIIDWGGRIFTKSP